MYTIVVYILTHWNALQNSKKSCVIIIDDEA